VPNGLSFSEFRGYEAWQVVSISQNGNDICCDPRESVMAKANLAGVPGNCKPFPRRHDSEIYLDRRRSRRDVPGATVPGTQHEVDFMAKDSKRFEDNGRWGYTKMS
jgi:hypothetical protein